jgi:cytochrome o ubiquinol oxidase subunit 1
MPFFGIMSMIIAIPTGVKLFNWLFTLYRGRIRFEVPVLWAIGFMVTFAIGGMTGVLLAVPPADFVLHNSLFLVAHFHNVIIGAVVFGAMAGLLLLVPQGVRVHARPAARRRELLVLAHRFLSRVHAAVCARAAGHDAAHAALRRPELAALSDRGRGRRGHHSLRHRRHHRAARGQHPHARAAPRSTGDPWNGRTLEWSTASPPPAYNFAVLPQVESLDAFWAMKQRARAPAAHYEPIEMPGNSANGFVTAFFAVVTGFAMIWHIWWLAILGLACAALTCWPSAGSSVSRSSLGRATGR